MTIKNILFLYNFSLYAIHFLTPFTPFDHATQISHSLLFFIHLTSFNFPVPRTDFTPALTSTVDFDVS